MIKLFVSDLDGTLLNSDHKVSAVTKDAVKRIREAGVSFMPASGRDYVMLMDVMSQLEIKPKCICLNGAQFYDNDGKLLTSYPVPEEKLRQVFKMIDEYNLDVDFFTESGTYNYGEPELFYDICLARYMNLFHDNNKQNLLKFMDDNKLLQVTTCTRDKDEIIAHKVMKVEIYFSNHIQRNAIFKAVRHIEGIAAVGSHDLNLEITSRHATKGSMVERVCEYYGYAKDEVVVIGDGFNDASMFQNFTNSFCMGQASEDLKNLATYVAKSNIENGVADVIEKLLANNLEIDNDKF